MLIAVASIAGGRERTFRVVTVKGTRVHLRGDVDVPMQLGHNSVRRHLHRGEAFYTEKVGVGISFDGSNYNEVWFFCISLRDSRDRGWIHSKYLVETAGHYSPDPPDTPLPALPASPIPAARPTPPRAPVTPPLPTTPVVQPAVPLIEPPSPWQTILPSIISIVSDCFAMIAAILSIMASILTANILHGRTAVPASPAYVSTTSASSPAIPVGSIDSRLIYGGDWWVPTNPKTPRRTHEH
jgi:hypothetical protein